MTVVERSPVARNTGDPNGDISFAVHLQGNRNTVKNANITNLGAVKWCAFLVVGTSSKGRIINPKINGSGYETHIRTDVTHLDALIDYDPINLPLDRTISTTRLYLGPGARTIVRDRSLGQTLPAGFVDEFERSVTVNGLAATDDGKTWLYRDSGSGNAAGWQATSAGVAKYVGAGARALAVVDGVSANGTLVTTVGAISVSQGAGIAARVTDWNNFIGLDFSWGAGNNQIALHKRVAGTRAEIAQSAVGAVTADSVIELVLNGTSVSVKLNGTEIITRRTVTEQATVTLHGLLGNANETALSWKRLEFIPV